MKRRDFFKTMGLGSLMVTLPSLLQANTNPHIVIVGGGYAGRTAAKFLKLWGGSNVDVTIIDSNDAYVSPILSNLVLNGEKSITDLTFDYTTATNNYNINFVQEEVTSIDSNAKSVTLADNQQISYDKLVLASGIDFSFVNDYDTTKVPHAWIAGEQTTLLKNQLDTLVDGDRFIMSIPAAPYRCPPGPYERACVVADYLQNIKKVDVEVIVLDANSNIIVEEDSFTEAFNRYSIDYRANSIVTQVDDTTMEVTFQENTTETTLSAKVLNIIPNQKAASIVCSSGLCDESNFAPVNLTSYESLIKNDIYIIGDSHKSSQPKAGHIANSEAKICADAILRTLNGSTPYSAPKTNSACYSPLSSSTATWLTAVYKYDAASNDMVMVSGGAGVESSSNYSKMFYWAGNLFSDTFS